MFITAAHVKLQPINSQKKGIGVLDLTAWDPEMSRRVNRIAAELRRPYVDLITSIGNRYEQDIDWWVSSIASRNTLASNIFFYCCYLYLIHELILEDFEIDKIIVDSSQLKKMIDDYLLNENRRIDVEIQQKSNTSLINLKERLKKKYLLGFLNTCRLVLKPLLASRLSCRYAETVDLNNEYILIDTYLLDSGMSDEGRSDHFYPNLYDHITDEEKKRVVFTPTYYQIKNYISTIKKIRTGQINFILKEDYLRFTDYLYAFKYPLRVHQKFKFKGIKLGDIDLDHLLNEEMRKSSISHSSIEALLKYRFARRLRKKGVQLKLVISWFENQDIDHGFNGGFRNYYPGTNIWGYQSFPQPDNYLCAFPTEQERKCQVIPNTIFVMGDGLTGKPKRYCPGLDVKVAPPLRFGWIWDQRKLFPDERYFTVLIALPYSKDEGSRLLGLIYEILPSLDSNIYRFWVKPHPTNSIDSVKQSYVKNWPEEFECIEGNLYNYLEKVNLLLTTSSSVCLDTISKGIPLICMASLNGIIKDYIPEDVKEDIWSLCYTKEELLKAVLFYSHRDENTIKRHQEIGKKIRKMFFEPVTRKGVRRFLMIEN